MIHSDNLGMTNSRMTNDECPESAVQRAYDLEERTAVFGKAVIDFALAIKRNAIIAPFLTQLIKSATSIGANYCEADDAESKKDFRHKIGICRKEARETKYWFRMVARAGSRSKTVGQTALERSARTPPHLFQDPPLLR
jgi:four helix bundle protein